MRSVEAEGASVDEAVERALSELGSMDRADVKIDVLEHTVKGARIRATVLGPRADVSRETTGDVSDLASSVLHDIVVHLVDDPRIEVSADDSGAIALSVVSDDGGSIIGRRGQTLDALEHLVNRIVFRDERVTSGRISIDVEGYRERREESLRELARRLAEKARETGQIVTVNPLSPRDRRIVHLELEGHPNVSTRSEGEGLFRRLLIIPETGSPRR